MRMLQKLWEKPVNSSPTIIMFSNCTAIFHTLSLSLILSPEHDTHKGASPVLPIQKLKQRGET